MLGPILGSATGESGGAISGPILGPILGASIDGWAEESWSEPRPTFADDSDGKRLLVHLGSRSGVSLGVLARHLFVKFSLRGGATYSASRSGPRIRPRAVAMEHRSVLSLRVAEILARWDCLK